jgi:hypothetical protein
VFFSVPMDFRHRVYLIFAHVWHASLLVPITG